MIINAKDYGISPDCDCTAALAKMLSELSKIQGQKQLIFEKGTYYISRDGCPCVYRAITNTTAAQEYKNPDEVNMHHVAFLLEKIEDLTIDAGSSTFVIDGKVTNAVISECKNITIRNITIKTISPNMHKLTVTGRTPLSATFSLWEESKYIEENSKYYWVGNGYRLGFLENSNTAFWTASIRPNAENKVFRTAHPFRGAVKIEETEPYKFKANYLICPQYKVGQTFYVFNAHRSDVGFFVEKSENITLDNVSQTFNYSLAYVAQDCENLTIQGCSFAPDGQNGAELASLADFVQICMCSGKISICGNTFDGAADDALNVHGIHFGIDEVNKNEITVSFRHAQSWGFNPLHAGDAVEFINPSTMLSVGSNRIISSELKDDRHIKLTMENPVPMSCLNCALEDVDRCPELLFANNTVNRIITRAILYTSRGRCVITGNHFISNSMSGVLLSDDAKSWYESGMCTDVTIKDNVFEYCGKTPILVYPENARHGGAVHKNITIENNVFKKYRGFCIKLKSAQNVLITGNAFAGGKPVDQNHCSDVKMDI